MTIKTPPNGTETHIPLVTAVRNFHKVIYQLGHKLNKRDRFAIHGILEKTCLELLVLIIEASFEIPANKIALLKTARTKTEILKHLVRTESELKIVDNTQYLALSQDLQTISKMISGWLTYLNQNPAK